VTTEALGWYASIFLWLFCTGVGVPPCPEEAGILYAAGLNALHREVRWPLAWAATGLGIVCADAVLYGVGRRWGTRLFDYRWVKRVMSAERRQRIERKFHTHGVKLLLLARFLPPLRTGIFLIAGAARFSFVKFLLADLTYAVFGVGLFFWGGTWLIDLLKPPGTSPCTSWRCRPSATACTATTATSRRARNGRRRSRRSRCWRCPRRRTDWRAALRPGSCIDPR